MLDLTLSRNTQGALEEVEDEMDDAFSDACWAVAQGIGVVVFLAGILEGWILISHPDKALVLNIGLLVLLGGIIFLIHRVALNRLHIRTCKLYASHNYRVLGRDQLANEDQIRLEQARVRYTEFSLRSFALPSSYRNFLTLSVEVGNGPEGKEDFCLPAAEYTIIYETGSHDTVQFPECSYQMRGNTACWEMGNKIVLRSPRFQGITHNTAAHSSKSEAGAA